MPRWKNGKTRISPDDGAHVHWPDLDEDISVEGLIAGWPSRETKESFARWIVAKKAGRPLELYELAPSTAPDGD